jgi:hypothetical protein
MLGYNLSLHGTEKKIRQLLDDLLGPVFSLASDEEARKKHQVLGMDKHDLLKDVLQHFRNNKWQRLYMEYFDQLSEFTKNQEKPMVNGNHSSMETT